MKLLTTFATIFILSSFAIPTSTLAQTNEDNAAANALFVEAAGTYREASATSGRERIELLRAVASTLNIISEQYPGTLPASRIEERNLGSIDLAAIEAAVGPQGYEAMPLQVATAIELTAEKACGEAGTTSCKSELSEALVEYIAVLAFDLDRASDVEQLSWLFSNPGRFNDNLARVNAFSDLLEDNAFRDNFIERVNRRVISDMAVEASADLAFSLLTGVVSETLAQHYEAQGYDEAAGFTRTWMEPIVEASLVLEGASTASTTGAGVGATIVWAKNVYAFWQLGEKQYRAEQTGATADQQLELLAAKIDSYTRTLISGRLTGVAFEGSEGVPLTDRHAEVIKSSLEQHYELQQYWLNSDDAVLLETFDAVLHLARAFYERLSEPTPLNAADGAGALPTDLQGLGLQPAPDGFLGPPPVATSDSSGAGLIGSWLHKDLLSGAETSNSRAPLCTTEGEGAPWRITPERIVFYESSCSFPSPLVASQTVYNGTVTCNGEGENWSETIRLERIGADLTYEANGYMQELVSCALAEPESSNRMATNSAEVWIEGRFDAPNGYDWLQLASRPSYGEAVEFVRQSSVSENLKIFLSENGLFAISMGPSVDFPWIRDSDAALKDEGKIPDDAYYTRGVGYVRQYATDPAQAAIEPAIEWSTALRRTETFRRAADKSRIYTNDFVAAGNEVVIWGRYGEDCLIDGHEGVFAGCSALKSQLKTSGNNELLNSNDSSLCSPAGEPLNTGGIFDFLVSKHIQGRTASGNEWSLVLNDDRPSNIGQASFTNAARDVSTGVWYVGGTDSGNAQLCQSYNGGSSFVCHEVFPCISQSNANFAMKNEEGEISSTITTQSRGTPPSISTTNFTREVTLSWAGREQGIVGTFTVLGEKEEDGLRLSLTAASGRYNANAGANPVEPGEQFSLRMNASPRKLCEGCRPQESFSTSYGLTFGGNLLNGPTQPMTLLVPNDVLMNNDVISISLWSADTIFITDTTLRISELMTLGRGEQSPLTVSQAVRGAASTQNTDRLDSTTRNRNHIIFDALPYDEIAAYALYAGLAPELVKPRGLESFESRRVSNAILDQRIQLLGEVSSTLQGPISFSTVPAGLPTGILRYNFNEGTFALCVPSGVTYLPDPQISKGVFYQSLFGNDGPKIGMNFEWEDALTYTQGSCFGNDFDGTPSRAGNYHTMHHRIYLKMQNDGTAEEFERASSLNGLSMRFNCGPIRVVELRFSRSGELGCPIDAIELLDRRSLNVIATFSNVSGAWTSEEY